MVGFDPSRETRATSVESPYDAVIVGAGFSGLAVAARLATIGIDRFVVLERAESIGGTWRENTYPGCACDIPSHLYSLSFAPKSDWSRMYATQPEIRRYMEEVASTCGLRAKIRCNARVENATWDAGRSLWHVEIEDAEPIETRALISAVGPLTIPSIPKLPGLDSFEGRVFHSATWDHAYSLEGKRVAVVGTGASAIQFVPAIAPLVEHMDVYQRSPPWIVPKMDRPIPDATIERFRRFPVTRLWERYRLFWIHEGRADAFTRKPELMKKSEGLARRLIRKQIADEELRRKVTPDYAMGCKRLLISGDYYPALARDNVDLITDPVHAVYATGVETATGERRDVDAIIFGTGFDVQSGLLGFPLVGEGGRSLAQAWSAGKEAYLGTTVGGFPNFFMMIGPNTALAHNSQIFMIEAQARYAASALRKLLKRPNAALAVRADRQRTFNAWIASSLSKAVWSKGGCSNWYLDPKTGRNSLLWPGSAFAFWRRMRRFRANDYLWTTPAHGTRGK